MNRGSLSMSNARPSTIVIVDDDVVTNRMLQAILTRSGFAAVGAFDAAGGLSKIRDTQPDLVLLDVQLPDGDGFDLCQRLHLETGLAQVPVLFVSSNEDVASKVRGFAAGGVDYIPKPFAGEEVIARVSTHLRLKHAYEKLAELQAERVQRLAMAQETIMPAAADLPEARFQIALRQTLQAGGDFYDVIPVGPQMVDYVVADASGHDLAASFWTAALKTLLAEYAHLASSPMNVLRSINAALCRILPEGVYFTLTYARLNRRIHRLVLANAGHPPALVLPSHAEQAFLNDLESDVVGRVSRRGFCDRRPERRPRRPAVPVLGRLGGTGRLQGSWHHPPGRELRRASESAAGGFGASHRRGRDRRDPTDRRRVAYGHRGMRSSAPSERPSWRCEMPSVLKEVDAVCLRLRGFLRARWSAPNTFRIELVARECLNNAVLHGNRSDPSRKVRFEVVDGRKWLRMAIGDEGNGFAWRQAVRRSVPGVDATGGRGLPISYLYARRVRFNRRGNRIALWFERGARKGEDL